MTIVVLVVYSPFFIIKTAVSTQLPKIVLEGALLYKNSSTKYLIAKKIISIFIKCEHNQKASD